MSQPAKKMTREEFYQRIWTTPIVALGKELGFSYLEMVRMCTALNVPRPTGGYWYRLAHGGVSEQVPLPPAPPGTTTEFEPGNSARFEHQVAPENQPTMVHVQAESSNEASARSEPNEALEEMRETKGVGKSKPEVLQVGGEVSLTEGSAASHANQACDSQQPAPRGESTAASTAKDSKTAQPSKSAPAGKVVYTRRQMYDAIWSTPCQVLAKTLGISDVALAKTCKRMGIPRPSRGYWAKVGAGQDVPKKPLPSPVSGQDRILTFDVETNAARREQASESFRSERNLEDLAVELELPDAQTPLHPVAERHRVALEKAKTGENELVRLDRKELFHCEITPKTIPRLCQALHALLGELQARGYKFKASAQEYGNLEIVKGTGSSSLKCSEVQEQLEREPTAADKRKPCWTWQLKEMRATGRLSFEVRARGLRGRRAWTEKENRPLEEVLGIVAEKVDGVFCGFEEQRKREAEEAKHREEAAKRWEKERAEEEKRRAEEEKQRREREKLKRHEAKLDEIEEARRENLAVAARQWVDEHKVIAFIAACEHRWRQAGGGQISKPQSEWLTWARAEAVKISPFGKGYPDPAKDGQFDHKSVAMGGPYPEVRALEDEEAVEADSSEIKPPEMERTRAAGQAPWSSVWG